MKPANPQIAALKDLIALEEKRAAIQEQLNAVEQRISSIRESFFSGSRITASSASVSSVKAKAAIKSSAKKPGGTGGTYRDYIMAALEAAGAAGIRVKDLAISMKTKPVNIHSWFHSNVKRIPSIIKVTGGHYRIGSSGKASAPAAAAPAPKAAKVSKRKGGTKRGALSASIMEALKEAGAKGIKIADLADKVGGKYKNIYIWFATTGKKNPAIKRIAPATYRLQS